MNDKNPHEKPSPYDQNPHARYPSPYDQNPHQKPNPSPYDQNPNPNQNKNKKTIIIAVCITVAACAVLGVSAFFLVQMLNKGETSPKTTEVTESSAQVTQTYINEVDTTVEPSSAVPPSTAASPSTGVIVDPPMTTVQPTTKVITNPPPTQEDAASALFQRLSGRDLMAGFVHGSQNLTVNADGSFTMLYHHLIYDNSVRTMEYFSEAGSFSNVKKLNDFTYSMRIADAYTTTSEADAEKVSEGYPTKAVEDSFGLYGGGEAIVYMPEAPLSQIPESVLNKGGKMVITPNGDHLGYYCLVDAEGTRYYSKAY